MNGVFVIFFGFVFLLGIWKVHDLIFQSTELQKEQNKQQNLIRFFAEFIYKTIEEDDDYKEAPQQIYKWLATHYQDWLDQQDKS